MQRHTQSLTIINGIIMDPDSHDGLLFGLSLSNKPTSGSRPDLTIRWSAVDGALFELTLCDIVASRFNDFMRGNVIFDFQVQNAHGMDDADVAFLFGFGGPPKSENIPGLRLGVHGATALKIGASYGCEGIALSRTPPSEWICTRLDS